MVAVCFKTRFGRYMYVIGGGEAVTRNSGHSRALAGVAGTLAVARVGAAGPTLGTDLLLNTLAAGCHRRNVVIGWRWWRASLVTRRLIITILDDELNLP